jgi:hypothetical protein
VSDDHFIALAPAFFDIGFLPNSDGTFCSERVPGEEITRAIERHER